MRTFRPVIDDLPMEEIKRLLSWVGFLEPLSEDELEGLVGHAGFLRLGDGEELILGPGQQGESMLILVVGQLQVYVVSPSERELTLQVLGSGSVVGATGLAARAGRDLRVRALEPSLVCRVDRADLEALVTGNHESAIRLAKMLAEGLIVMEDRWADAAEKGVPARLAGLLLMLAEDEGVMTREGPVIPTRYTHQQLGSMIGSNREAVTRAFSKLQQGGGVELRGRRVHVTDPDALRRAAGE